MKILFIHNRYKYLGGEDVAIEMEQTILRQYGHKTDTLLFDNTAIDGILSKIGTSSKALYNKTSASLLRDRIKIFQPDVIHIHNLFFLASPSVLFEAARHEIPVVMTLHNYRLICANGLLLRNNKVCERCINKTVPLDGIVLKCYRNSAVESALSTAVTSTHKIIKTWLNKVNRYIVLTEFGKDKFVHSSLKIPADKFIVKPNFVDDLGAGPEQREDFFLFVGRISIEKGAAVLLEAFAHIPQKKLIVVGDGPERAALEEKYGALQNISFVGSKNKQEVATIMKQTRALIFPSIWYEGLPFTIIESMSAGTPVIASRLGAMADVIKDGINGYLFTAGSAEDLRNKILSFEGERSSKKIYENSRLTYERHYHPDIHYQSILNIYENAVKEKKSK